MALFYNKWNSTILAFWCNNTSFIYFPTEDCFRYYNGKESDMSHQVASKSSKYFHVTNKIAHFWYFFFKFFDVVSWSKDRFRTQVLITNFCFKLDHHSHFKTQVLSISFYNDILIDTEYPNKMILRV